MCIHQYVTCYLSAIVQCALFKLHMARMSTNNNYKIQKSGCTDKDSKFWIIRFVDSEVNKNVTILQDSFCFQALPKSAEEIPCTVDYI